MRLWAITHKSYKRGQVVPQSIRHRMYDSINWLIDENGGTWKKFKKHGFSAVRVNVQKEKP